MNPLTALPVTVRKWIYVFYATFGIAFGAAQVGFATAGQDQPLWLLVAFSVFGYLGTALGLVAAANLSETTVRHVFDAGSIGGTTITPGSISTDQITARTITFDTDPETDEN